MMSYHFEVWRDYLAGQMRERYGLAKQEAQNITDGWLRSVEERVAPPARSPQQTPVAAGARNQRLPSSQRLGTKPPQSQTQATA
jgi:hypothetical protein